MVKEGQLKPEDVAIYYFEKEENETTATRYNIEEDGFMDKSLPESFIGNSYNLAMKLLK
jgi:predicted ATPase